MHPDTSLERSTADLPRGDLINADDLLSGELEDPEFRARWERTAIGRAVALWLVRYRAERGLSQRALARELNVSQPLIARLESGEHAPDIATLLWLADMLGVNVHLDIMSQADAGSEADEQIVEEISTDRGSRLAVTPSSNM